MPLTLELPPDMENRLNQEAARNGMEPEPYVQNLIARHLKRAQRRIALTPTEQAQLDALNAELTAEFWQQYHLLQDCLRDGTIAENEHRELLELIQKTEEWNVRRLTLLEEMAQRRGIHFPDLMKVLGIRHHPNAGGT